jgi:acyl-[acyl-carrier-protein]-phospholipid O-acyltransferase/long-chain-fatty-acid--[acyl-carrier-protein] ligase
LLLVDNVPVLFDDVQPAIGPAFSRWERVFLPPRSQVRRHGCLGDAAPRLGALSRGLPAFFPDRSSPVNVALKGTLETSMPRAYDVRAGRRTVFDALIDIAASTGWKKPILEDQDRRPLTYLDLVRAAFALGRKIADRTEPGERVGVLLPTGVGVAVTFFALHAYGRVPVMLNFTAGLKNVAGACDVAGVRRVLCARKFIEQAKLEPLTDALAKTVDVVMLEDVRTSIGLPDRLLAAAAGAAPRAFRAKLTPEDPGVILFTSGSFGTPRGVVLTHENLVANVVQVASHIDLDPDWVFFNPLPAFHSFGLTAGVLLPLLTGSKGFQYPSPLHVKQIPPLVKKSGASVMFGTDTFIGQYARSATPDEMSGLKFIVCGAEKVRDETHRVFADKFGGVMVLEGYGATECAPVIAVNQPTGNRRARSARCCPRSRHGWSRWTASPRAGGCSCAVPTSWRVT